MRVWRTWQRREEEKKEEEEEENAWSLPAFIFVPPPSRY